MKKVLIKLGNIIAALLMFSPVIILFLHDRFKLQEFIFLMICSILYSVYYYSIIKFDNYMEEEAKLYNDVKRGKAINSSTGEEKTIWFSVIGIDVMEKYLENKDK